MCNVCSRWQRVMSGTRLLGVMRSETGSLTPRKYKHDVATALTPELDTGQPRRSKN